MYLKEINLAAVPSTIVQIYFPPEISLSPKHACLATKGSKDLWNSVGTAVHANPQVRHPLIVYIHIRVYVRNCFPYIDLYKTHEATEGYCIPSLFIATSRTLFLRDSIRFVTMSLLLFIYLFIIIFFHPLVLSSMEKEFGLNYGGSLEIT